MKEDSVKIGKRWPSIYRPWREALEEIDPGNVDLQLLASRFVQNTFVSAI